MWYIHSLPEFSQCSQIVDSLLQYCAAGKPERSLLGACDASCEQHVPKSDYCYAMLFVVIVSGNIRYCS